MNGYILEMRNISKSFPGVKALDNVNFAVRQGEIHCLVGENGAGKSTLMKVLSGIHRYGSYEGDIVFDGEIMKFHTIRESENAGISIINHSETSGLGANAAADSEIGRNFRSQFIGQGEDIALAKNGGEIDHLTGATITSNAVTGAVATAIQVVKSLG